jgi:Transglutaminase-like superfamily
VHHSTVSNLDLLPQVSLMPGIVVCANPSCARRFGIPEGAKDKKVQCPFCNQIFRVSLASPPIKQAPARSSLPRSVPTASSSGRRRPFVGGVFLTALLFGGLLMAFLLLRPDADDGSERNLSQFREQADESQKKAETYERVIANLRKKTKAEADASEAAFADLRKKTRTEADTIEAANAELRKNAKAEAEASNAAISVLRKMAASETEAKINAQMAEEQAKRNLDAAGEDLLKLQQSIEAVNAALEKAMARTEEAETTARSKAAALEALRNRLAYKDIDEHALSALPEAENSIESLAKYLGAAAADDKQKARAIYRWITGRIAYDAKNFLAGTPSDTRPEAVLKNRVAVCEGYANLFVALSGRMNLKAVKVSGKGKGPGYIPPSRNVSSEEKMWFNSLGGHSWNAVWLDNQWWLIDSTWGAGHLKDTKFVRRYVEFYFLAAPEKLGFTHLPQDPQWHLTKTPLTPQQFVDWPNAEPEHWALGITPAAVRAQLLDQPQKGLVLAYNTNSSRPGAVASVAMPLAEFLDAGKEYTFKFNSEELEKMSCRQGGKNQFFRHVGNEFQITIRPQQGQFIIDGWPRNGGKGFGILSYMVQ